MSLLVVKTNIYHDHLDRLDGGPSHLPDVTGAEMPVFLVLTIQLGHCIRDIMTDYRAMSNQFHTSYYGRAMKLDILLHPSLSALHRQQE